MRISFDLDDTLICYDPAVPCEPNRVPWLWRFSYEEPLRLGSVALMQQLKNEGHSLWRYTTSYRTPQKIRKWFRFYGIELEGVVNQEMHERFVGRDRFDRYVSKYPPVFDIDLHVDDLEGVGIEGEERGFRVVIVSAADENWTQKVKDAVEEKFCEEFVKDKK